MPMKKMKMGMKNPMMKNINDNMMSMTMNMRNKKMPMMGSMKYDMDSQYKGMMGRGSKKGMMKK